MELETDNIGKSRFKQVGGVHFTERDEQLLLFILTMKFSTIEDLHLKFFSRLQSGEISKSLTYAAERVGLLKGLGLIRTVKHPRKWSHLILPTLKGYYLIRDLLSNDLVPKPSQSYDLNTFDHDDKLLKLRIHLEETGLVKSWISDRQLRCFEELAGGLKGTFVPDAVFENTKGEKVALELEISQKSKSQYREKIRRYLYVLRKEQLNKPFSRVHFICAKDLVKKHIENETKLYPDLFLVQSLSEIQLTNKSTK